MEIFILTDTRDESRRAGKIDHFEQSMLVYVILHLIRAVRVKPMRVFVLEGGETCSGVSRVVIRL